VFSHFSGDPKVSVSQNTSQNFVILGLQEDRLNEIRLLLNSNLTLNLPLLILKNCGGRSQKPNLLSLVRAAGSKKVLRERTDMEYMRATEQPGVLRQHRYYWRRGTTLMGEKVAGEREKGENAR